MKAGDKERFDCEDCSKEFEVILEPKAVGLPEAQRPKDTGKVKACPFCGGRNIIGDNDG